MGHEAFYIPENLSCLIADAVIPALCPIASGTVVPQSLCNAPVCPGTGVTWCCLSPLGECPEP